MLKTNMEFSKGILFVRIRGDLNINTVKVLDLKDFKFIVLNIDNMYSIDSYCIKYLNSIYKKFKSTKGKIILCDKYNISKKLLRGIPRIDREYDAYELFERMI